jgi:hypothetical protein
VVSKVAQLADHPDFKSDGKTTQSAQLFTTLTVTDYTMEDSEYPPIVLNLQPGPESTGHVKSDIPPEAHKVENSGFYITIRRVSEIHGLFESQGPSGSHASLVILQFELGSENTSQVKRFKYFHPILTFTSDPETEDPLDNPRIVSYSPAQENDLILSESFVKITENLAAQANLQFSVPGTGPGAGGQISSAATRETNKPYYYRVSGTTRKSVRGKGNPENVVSWTLREDKLKGVGIGNMRVAILIERRKDTNFKIDIDNWAKADWRYWITDKFRQLGDFTGLQHKKDFEGGQYTCLKYDWSKSSKQVPKNIEPNNLHDASLKDLLDTLSYLQVPEITKPKQSYSKGK